MRKKIVISVLFIFCIFVIYRFVFWHVTTRKINLTNTEMVEVVVGKKGLYVDIHEVTNKQFNDFAKKKIYRKSQSYNINGRNNPKQPVTGVKLYSAKAYCKECEKRLMNIDDYKLILGGFKNRYEFGKHIDTNQAVFSLKYMDKKLPNQVMTKSANKYGIFDLTGNVWEMLDNIDENGEILLVGGAYYTTKEGLRIDSLIIITSKTRGLTDPSFGFRCVR